MIALELLSLFIAILAFLVAWFAIRYQILVLIYDQVGEKARECNSFLDNHKIDINDTEMLVGILFSVLTAGQIISTFLKQNKFWGLKSARQNILDIYYLQLHVAVRGWIFEQKSDDGLVDETMQQQFNDCLSLLKDSHKRLTSNK